MNVVDSSAWLEYFADGPNAGFFANAVEDDARLVVPALCILEVMRRIWSQRGEHAAMEAAGAMHRGRLAVLDGDIAVTAARLSREHKLALADSVVLATARLHQATLWTQDADFAGIPGVRYRPWTPPPKRRSG